MSIFARLQCQAGILALAHTVLLLYCVTAPARAECNYDWIFILDNSGSVGSSDFQLLKDFVVNISSEINIGIDRNLVAVISYANSASLHFGLKHYTDKASLLTAIRAVPYTGGGTNTAAALQLLQNNTSLNLRNGSRHIVIVLTDGHSSDTDETLRIASHLHSTNVYDIFTVGIGNANVQELYGIASHNDSVFMSVNFTLSAVLDDHANRILLILCSSPADHCQVHPDDTEEYIILVNTNRINRLNLTAAIYHNLVIGLQNGVAIDYHYNIDRMYWTDVSYGHIRSAPLSTGYPVVTLVSGLEVPDGLAIDWINDKIYWTDAGRNTLEQSDLFGISRKILILLNDTDEPRGIALDPLNDALYMTDWGTNPRIEKMHLDGTNRQSIITQGLRWPNAVTIDYLEGALFWADAWTDTVARGDLNGNNIVILVRNPDAYHPFDLTQFGEYLYWTDWNAHSIERISKHTAGVNHTRITGGFTRPSGVQIVHPSRQSERGIGNEFYLGFFDHLHLGHPSIVLMTTESQNVSYCISAPGVGFYQSGIVTNNSEVIVDLPSSLIITSVDQQDRGIYLRTSSSSVNVIGQSIAIRGSVTGITVDTYNAIPLTTTCTSEYVYFGMLMDDNSGRYSIILVVGTENSTVVNLNAIQTVHINVNGDVFIGRQIVFVINRLQTILIRSTEDLTGTKIVTDKPVSVFSGHQCAQIPSGVTDCGHLIEQIPPTTLWDRVYYTAPLSTRRSYTIKVLAASNSTSIDIFCNGTKEPYTINEGMAINKTLTHQEYCAVSSNKPTLVAQFSHGYVDDNDGDSVGDPMMLLVPGINIYSNKFSTSAIRTPHLPSTSHYLNIIVLAQYYQPDKIYLISGGVNKSLDTQEWVPVKVNNVIEAYAAKVNIPEDVVEVIHTDTSVLMTVALYGFASNRGYGHPGGIFGYPYLRPVVSLLAIDNQTVGQPLVLECTVATVCRAIGEVSIVWSVDGVELRTTRSVNVSSYTQHSVVYTENYTTSQLHVSDNGKMYQCKVTLNTSVLVTATASITLAISGLVPVLEVFPSLIQGISIGTPQTLWCVLNNINGLDSSTVVASWNGPGGNIVTNNSRVTINPLKCNNINCTSSLQFTYLMEGDEGMYTCNNIIMILSTNVSGVIAIRNLTVPTPTISIMSPETQVVGQPLTLECNVTTVRGITSRVDIVWSSDGIEPQRTTGAVMHITNVNSVIYQDLYTISPLSTNDDGTTVKCDVMINVTPLVTATGNVTLFVRVPTPQIAMSPTGVIQGAMVGSPQHIQCKVSTINGVESSSVLIEWMGPGEELIVNNSRIIITPTISNGNNYTSGLQFTYLMEGDEGRYTCNVRILRTNISAFIKLSNLTVPPPAITMSAPNNGIVGQPLTLECNATAVRGITSRVNFVWKRGDNELQRSEGASVNTTNPISVLYHEFYTIPQLNTTDDGTTVSCNVIFNVVPPVMSTNNITLSAEVPTPLIVMSPAGVIQGAIIGSPQHIQCIVSTVNGVESSSVMIEWMGPGEESIVNNSKILITPTTSNGNNYTSSLQFIYLMEGDEGRYTCNVRILRTNVSQSISLYNFTVPVPNVIVTTSNTQTVGEPTTLECNVTVVRGITSRVDIVWSSDNVELKRSEAVDASTTSSNSTIYSDQYIISQVNTTDHGRVYQCKVVINTSLQVSAVGMVTLDVYVSRPMVAILPPNLNQGVIVGSSQTIQCVVIAAMRINSGSVIITWTGSHGRIISNDSRVTISPNTVTGNNYTSTLQLAYIMEDDEGTLSCHVTILNTTLSSSIEITNLTVPSPVVIAYAPEHQIVGQSLMLQCDVFTVRGITSRVDILWSSSGLVPSIARGIDVEYMTNDSSVYTNTYIISQLSTSDQNRDYQCTAVINRNPAIAAIDAVMLNVSVPKGSVVLSQSTPRLVSGLIQGLTCIATVAKGVSPSLVTLKWSRVGLQLDSPRVVISDQTSNGLQYTKSITFSPLLSRDGGQYNCSMTVTDFNEANVISYSVVQVHAPNLTVSLLPPVLIGNAREDSIELRCTAFVSENVIEDSYKFVWMKDGSSLQSVDQRIVVTDNAISSFYEINAADTSAVLHNGEYTCLVTLTIAGEDHFIKTTNGSRIILRDAIPPVQPVISAASTTSHSAYISWVVKLIVFDNETYTVWYGTDNEVQENSDVVIGNKNGLTTNEIFSVNITDLLPFTQYYYIVCAKNSIGNTNTSIMTFVTGETAPSVHPSNFRVASTTSNSVLFQWDPLISHANGIIRWYVIACSGKQSINVTGDTTRATVVGLNPFSNYNCTLHAVTVSSGPMTDPIIVRTAEKAPTPPIINTVTAINSMSLRVDWSTPSEANGILLIYSITYTNENGLKTINVPFNKQATQFYIIGGLAPYELVTVTITATNGGGTSGPSNELTGRTQQAASGVVQITTVISLSSNSVNVQWTPPSQSNGIITGYQVTYSVLDMNDAKVTSAVASNETNLNITDLNPGTPYQVVVLALNGAGKGQENKNRIFFSKELNPLNEPKNIVVTRNGTSANVTWDSLTLFEARGFPVYMVTLIPSSNSAVRTRRQSSDGIISINTTESSVVVEGLDENIEYNLSLAVATTAGIMEADKVVPVDESSTDEFRDNSSGNNSSVIIFAASGVAIVALIIAFIIIAVCLVQKRKKKDGYSTDQHIYDTVGLQSQVMQNHGLINDTTFRTNVTIPLKIHNPNLHGEYCEEVQENPYYLDTEMHANPAYQVADISTL